MSVYSMKVLQTPIHSILFNSGNCGGHSCRGYISDELSCLRCSRRLAVVTLAFKLEVRYVVDPRHVQPNVRLAADRRDLLDRALQRFDLLAGPSSTQGAAQVPEALDLAALREQCRKGDDRQEARVVVERVRRRYGRLFAVARSARCQERSVRQAFGQQACRALARISISYLETRNPLGIRRRAQPKESRTKGGPAHVHRHTPILSCRSGCPQGRLDRLR